MAKKVLVIDDEPEMLSLVKYTLEHGGFEVHTCDNGRHAWDAIAKVKPDVLVLDVMLPGIDGYSLQLKIAAEPTTKDLPIVVDNEDFFGHGRIYQFERKKSMGGSMPCLRSRS